MPPPITKPVRRLTLNVGRLTGIFFDFKILPINIAHQTDMSSFKDLKVWQEARDLAIQIYLFTNQGKFSRDFGLRDQIRRSCVSISSNIAEGCDRAAPKDFSRFLDIARGSSAELRAQLEIAAGVGYIEKDQFKKLDDRCMKISAMIFNLKKSINIAR